MTGPAVRLLTAGALAVSAYVHVDLSSTPYYAGGQITLGALFVAQAVVAAVVAAASLVGFLTVHELPPGLVSFTPHLTTLLVLSLASQRLRMPKADGLVYRRGEH